MLDVLALEDGGEGHEGRETAFAVEEHDRQLACGIHTILRGGGIHAATVVAALHGGSQPSLLIGEFLAVHNYGGCGGLVVEQQTLDGDGGVVYGLVGLSLLLSVSDLTAVSVDTKAYVVEEAVALALDFHEGQILYVGEKGERLVVGLQIQVAEEIIARAAGSIKNLTGDCKPFGVIDKTVDGTVTAAQDDGVVPLQGSKKISVIRDA